MKKFVGAYFEEFNRASRCKQKQGSGRDDPFKDTVVLPNLFVYHKFEINFALEN